MGQNDFRLIKTDTSRATAESSNLDLLRAVAVLAVFFCHLFWVRLGNRSLNVPWHLGQLGVNMFFVHTSVVLMWSMERLRSTGKALFIDFYVRRIARIYPLAIFCIIVFYCFEWAVRSPLPWRDLVANLLLAQNLLGRSDLFPVLWSLPLEVEMYAVMPFVFLFLHKRSLAWALAALVASLLLACVYHRFSGARLIWRFSPVGFAPCFFAGICAWKYLSEKRATPFIPGWMWPVSLLMTSVVWMIAPMNADLPFRWLYCIVLAASIPFFREIRTPWLCRAAKTVAKYSFGVYLAHLALQVIAFRWFASRPEVIQWGLLVVLSVTIPVLLYHGLEAPAIRLGARVAKRLTSRERRAERLIAVVSGFVLEAE